MNKDCPLCGGLVTKDDRKIIYGKNEYYIHKDCEKEFIEMVGGEA